MSRMYFVVAYVAGFARLRGWLEGRRAPEPAIGEGFAPVDEHGLGDAVESTAWS
jgi:hypothetical protein